MKYTEIVNVKYISSELSESDEGGDAVDDPRKCLFVLTLP